MEELNDMTDESLMLDIDIIEKEHEKEIDAINNKYKKELLQSINLPEQQLLLYT